MGYLTPILIRNDDLSQIEKHPDQFIQAVKKACNSFKEDSYGIGNCVNAIEALPTQHADMNRVIVVHGNTWFEISPMAWESQEQFEARIMARPLREGLYSDLKFILQQQLKAFTEKLKTFKRLNNA